jgi:hypothetical protein
MHAEYPTLCYSFHHQRFIFCSLTLSLSTCLALLAPICWVQLKTPCLAPSHPPPASACSDHTHSSTCQSIPCPRRPETHANHLRRSVGHAELQRGHPRLSPAQAQAQADRQTEGEASRDTCHHAPTTTTARILAKREGYVPVKVPAAVLLAGDDGRDQAEVRGVGQLDDLLCSSSGSCWVHPPKTRTTR